MRGMLSNEFLIRKRVFFWSLDLRSDRRYACRVSSQKIISGDCLDVFKDLPFRLQAIVSDPPAGIGFMGRKWDKHSPHAAYVPPIEARSKKHLRELQERHAFVIYWAARFAAAYDACEDDATALIWALPRTSDWTAEALRLAGWAIVDVITHHFGQGWPKGPNLLKPGSEHWILAKKGELNIDVDACRVERGGVNLGRDNPFNSPSWSGTVGKGKSAQARRVAAGLEPLGAWPANVLLSHAESCVCVGVRKVRGAHSTTGIWRKGNTTMTSYSHTLGPMQKENIAHYVDANGLESVPAYHCAVGCDCGRSWTAEAGGDAPACECGKPGWWACPVAKMDAQSGHLKSGTILPHHQAKGSTNLSLSGPNTPRTGKTSIGDEGGASRFFTRFGYYGKAPSGEKHAGCEGLYWRRNDDNPFGFDRIERAEWERLSGDATVGTSSGQDNREGRQEKGERALGNVHPTVKRLSLMRWLHRLTGAQRIGDLCGGSGSGMIAALLDGIDWIGAETCAEAIEIAEARYAFWSKLTPGQIAEFTATEIIPTAPKAHAGQLGLF